MDKKYFRILIKNHYDKPTDLVSRKLNRAIRKINNDFKNMITSDGVYLYGYVVGNQIFELFTGEMLDIDNDIYEKVDEEVVLEMLKSLKDSNSYYKLYFLIAKLLFNYNYKINFIEISTMEELSNDRYALFDEYNNNLTDINPYSEKNSNNYDDLNIKRLSR